MGTAPEQGTAVVSTRAVGLALGTLALLLTACGDTEVERSRVVVDLAPVNALVTAATQDADTMEQHATAIATAAESRPELAQWRTEADTIRSNAKSLRLLAAWAEAIRHDSGARSNESAELTRILGDGQNLQQLGETVIAHAGAMDAHLTAMRQQAGGDTVVASVASQLTTDTASMRREGQAAIGQGVGRDCATARPEPRPEDRVAA